MTRYVPRHRLKLWQTLTSSPRWMRIWLPLMPSTAVAFTFIFLLLHFLLNIPALQTMWIVSSILAAMMVSGLAGESLARVARKKWSDRRLARFSARGLTDLAALLAGRQRPALCAEWRAHLAGESGHDPVTWQKVKEALGFVASAIRCRCSDAADTAWTPVDAILKSRTLSNLFTLVPTALAALILFRHGETVGLLGSAESISAIYLTLHLLVMGGRKYRDMKPPEPKTRSARE